MMCYSLMMWPCATLCQPDVGATLVRPSKVETNLVHGVFHVPEMKGSA